MSANQIVYVGSYTADAGEGITILHCDEASGAISVAATEGGGLNPSYLCLHPNGRRLYAVNEVNELDGQPGGGVSAYAIDSETGRLRFLNRQSSGGKGPCYISLDPAGHYVLAANYAGGSVAAVPLTETGSLGEPTQVVQHQGSSVHPRRQAGPHAHSIGPDPTGRYILAADLGLDQIIAYTLDEAQGVLTPAGWNAMRPGAGPRHFCFHPNGRFAYVVHELDSTVAVFHYNAVNAQLTEVQTVSALPPGFTDKNSGADIHIHPSGRFLYSSNRGHDSIAVWAVDSETGLLTPVGHVSTQGRTPRNFALSPSGALLLAANQDSDTVVSFRIDANTGLPEPTGYSVAVPKPVCVKFRLAAQ